ncbi:hypothetical protein RSOLAG22IIIB_03121 [Rhizoctonia solani]|uniref:RRM domain-containing protein n=1 Tax=Rhizoctonia solani TaxID=456999 RepID=A0A0K6FMH9_9AGAM|nr:hypothetical protein RSOLAG22IIIB_03121 [Rhizoctonia solani]
MLRIRSLLFPRNASPGAAVVIVRVEVVQTSAAGTCSSDPRQRIGESHGQPSSRDKSGNPGTNLHISGLHPSVTDRHLEDTFSKYGKVEKAQVVYDPHTHESRCFGFVLMSRLSEAETAIENLNGYVLEGSALRVDKVLVAGELGLPHLDAIMVLRNEMNGRICRASMIIATVGMMMETITDEGTIDMTVERNEDMTATAEIGMTGTLAHVGKTGIGIQIVMARDTGTMNGRADSASEEVVTNHGDKRGIFHEPKNLYSTHDCGGDFRMV